MAELRQVTYCGLYCGLCAQRNRIPRQASDLRASMEKEGWAYFGPGQAGFAEFWRFLESLAASEARCSCRSGTCGPPDCRIRDCAQARTVEVCVYCDDYPCAHIEALARAYVNLLADGRRLREVGLDRWIAEQESRHATGFAYADIRCDSSGEPGK